MRGLVRLSSGKLVINLPHEGVGLVGVIEQREEVEKTSFVLLIIQKQSLEQLLKNEGILVQRLLGLFGVEKRPRFRGVFFVFFVGLVLVPLVQEGLVLIREES